MRNILVKANQLDKRLAKDVMIGPDYSCSCRPEQTTGSTAGTSVASGEWRLHQAGSSFERRLRRSGIALRDFVPAYMNNLGSGAS